MNGRGIPAFVGLAYTLNVGHCFRVIRSHILIPGDDFLIGVLEKKLMYGG